MGIVRGTFKFEDNYTLIPNEWVRDKTLSLKARGLLVELMSHRPGWSLTLASLESEHDGTAAVRTAVKELADGGWLTIQRQRVDGGLLGGTDYILSDPCRSEPRCENPHVDNPHVVNHAHKKTIPLEDDLKEPTSGFYEWWAVYPRKIAKPNAVKAYQAAVKKTTSETLLAAVGKLAGEWSGRSRDELKFCPHPATWLNQERWNDYQVSTDELDAAIADGSLERVRSLSSFPVPFFDAGDVSPAEAVAARKRFVVSWAKENYQSLVAGLK